MISSGSRSGSSARALTGSGLMLTGDPARQDWSGIQILARPGGSTMRLLNLDGKDRVIKPE